MYLWARRDRLFRNLQLERHRQLRARCLRDARRCPYLRLVLGRAAALACRRALGPRNRAARRSDPAVHRAMAVQAPHRLVRDDPRDPGDCGHHRERGAASGRRPVVQLPRFHPRPAIQLGRCRDRPADDLDSGSVDRASWPADCTLPLHALWQSDEGLRSRSASGQHFGDPGPADAGLFVRDQRRARRDRRCADHTDPVHRVSHRSTVLGQRVRRSPDRRPRQSDRRLCRGPGRRAAAILFRAVLLGRLQRSRNV